MNARSHNARPARWITPVATIAAVIVFALGGCGEEDTPLLSTAPRPTCNIDSTAVTLNITAEDWVYTSSYAPADPYGSPETTYWQARGSFDPVSVPLNPGSRVMLHVRFAAPLHVNWAPDWIQFLVSLLGSGQVATAQNFVFDSAGEWDTFTSTGVSILGTGNGPLRSLRAQAFGDPGSQGATLYCMVFEFTVPTNYNSGSAITSGSVDVDFVEWYTTMVGDHRGTPSPITAR